VAKKFIFFKFLADFFDQYWEVLDVSIYTYISDIIKIGLEGEIQAEFQYFLSVFLWYMSQRLPELGSGLIKYQDIIKEFSNEKPISDIFPILIG